MATKVTGKSLRCCAEVMNGYGINQCERNGKVIRDGKHYCRQHDPEAVAERNRRSQEKFDREQTVRKRLHDLAKATPDLLDACKAVKQRIHLIGMPQEPKLSDGRPDWSKEIALLEAALAKVKD